MTEVSYRKYIDREDGYILIQHDAYGWIHWERMEHKTEKDFQNCVEKLRESRKVTIVP